MKVTAMCVCIISFIAAASASAETISGMVGHWTFDEGSGAVAYDLSGTGNDAVLVGDACWTSDGKYGGAINLSGITEDYAQVLSPQGVPLGNSPRTIAAWVNWSGTELPQSSATPHYQAILSYGSGSDGAWCSLERGGDIFHRRLFFDTWGGSSALMNDVGGNTTNAFPVGQWMHVAMTYDGSTTKLYLNGQLDASIDSIPFNTVLNANGLRIGNSSWTDDGWHKNFSGLVDDVYLYSHALSETEIRQVMNNVPEPSMLVLLVAGAVVGLVATARRRWRI